MLLALRCIALVALSCSLLACQHAAPVAPAPVDPLADAFQSLDQQLASKQLDDAQTQLQDLQQRAPDDSRLEPYRRQLAEAFLLQGEALLQRGERKAAAQAFSQARLWLPAPTADSSPPPKPNAPRTTVPATSAPSVVATAPIKAQLIDPRRASSAVALPMLDTEETKRLRRLLDAVAADVVNFRCAVHLEVRQAKDVPWVTALLSARVKKLKPGFVLAISSKVDPSRPPRLLLSPAL
ncbi:MAG: hypothetical protein V4812_09735 [Pseudomonadota bacterium]